MEEFVKKNAENSNADRKQKAQPHFPDGITEAMVYDEQTERTIIWQVRQMVRGGLFAEHEGDDIAQKMRLAIWHRIGSFDASKGCELHSFITRVIMDKASNLRRARCRKLAREPEIMEWQGVEPKSYEIIFRANKSVFWVFTPEYLKAFLSRKSSIYHRECK